MTAAAVAVSWNEEFRHGSKVSGVEGHTAPRRYRRTRIRRPRASALTLLRLVLILFAHGTPKELIRMLPGHN